MRVFSQKDEQEKLRRAELRQKCAWPSPVAAPVQNGMTKSSSLPFVVPYKQLEEELRLVRRNYKGLQRQLEDVRLELQDERTHHNERREQEDEWQRTLDSGRKAERKKHIAHIQQTAAHRLQNRRLARGWNAWRDAWQKRSRTYRTIRAASSRLLRPKLVATLRHWRRGWEVAQQMAFVRKNQGKLAGVREQLERELQQVQRALQTAHAENEQLKASFARKLRDAQVRAARGRGQGRRREAGGRA